MIDKVHDINELKKIATKIRISVIESIAESGSGHLGGSLGLADIFTALYFNILNHDPENPNLKGRDKLVLSIGHVVPVQYAALAHSGYFPVDELITLRKLGSRLQGHPGKNHGLPGIELSSGSLGQGLSISVGMALASKIDGIENTIFCINGDGELQEGSNWEALMSAGHFKLDNFISIIDRNFVQIDGETENVMNIEPLKSKFEAFGWEVFECDGNSISDFFIVINQAKNKNGKPKAIIAKTLMGKGVKEIEGNYLWHGKAPNQEEKLRFISQISKLDHGN